MDLRFIDIMITNATLFTNMISSDRVMFVYLSCTFCGIYTLVIIDYFDSRIFFFAFSDPMSGPNMFSAKIM